MRCFYETTGLQFHLRSSWASCALGLVQTQTERNKYSEDPDPHCWQVWTGIRIRGIWMRRTSAEVFFKLPKQRLLQELWAGVEGPVGDAIGEQRPRPAGSFFYVDNFKKSGGKLLSVSLFSGWQYKTHIYLKGTVSRDFLLQIFFMNHLPPSHWK